MSTVQLSKNTLLLLKKIQLDYELEHSEFKSMNDVIVMLVRQYQSSVSDVSNDDSEESMSAEEYEEWRKKGKMMEDIIKGVE